MSSPVPDITTPAPAPFVPEYPFANAPGADVILRSADGADFYVHRAILSLVSPVFETMFQLPQPDGAPPVPVIDVQEESAVLDRALRFFYPAAPASVTTLEELQDIMEVLVAKYDVQFVVPAVKQHLERFKTSKPLAVYALGFKYGWKDVASSAAKESLKTPLRALGNDAPPELGGITAIAYHNLLQYHYLCGAAARTTVSDSLAWLDAPRSLRFQWFSAYLTIMSGVLETTPGVILHENSNFHVALGQSRCNKCNIFNEFMEFVFSQWPAKLAEEMDKIELKF
ncbi:hypothetical protein C8F04DRAFT_1289142 [Mycena alexandri]|uniref:BTB domain-containing protein n=1 Tax=Mycena alexandri TaxID=1745969 RepID=A0AAD6SCS4_9AGAR|nr:hypothetical protein C8F04DRAFT_1300714 [Mycena alexandri]KAJ7028968.1 hypothetical protein C8F04DRAFT_1289142 [Mycena alexandri]